MATTKDKFVNMATIQLTESAANTLTFKKLETGISLFEKVAWIIHRVEYLFSAASYATFNGSGDVVEYGLAASDQITALAITNAAVIDYGFLARLDLGTAASGNFYESPLIRDLTTLPMGGILVPPNPLYLAVKGTGLSAATILTARFFYTTYVLTPDDYWELVEARRIISST